MSSKITLCYYHTQWMSDLLTCQTLHQYKKKRSGLDVCDCVNVGLLLLISNKIIRSFNYRHQHKNPVCLCVSPLSVKSNKHIKLIYHHFYREYNIREQFSQWLTYCKTNTDLQNARGIRPFLVALCIAKKITAATEFNRPYWDNFTKAAVIKMLSFFSMGIFLATRIYSLLSL